MRITTQGDYGLRCLMVIARFAQKGPASIRRIVDEEELPEDYVEQLLLKLRRGKLITSVRGVNGGYLLIRPAKEISIRHVLEAVEGHTFEVICSRSRKPRKRQGRCHEQLCVLRDVWVELKTRIEDHLGGITVQDLIDKEARDEKNSGSR